MYHASFTVEGIQYPLFDTDGGERCNLRTQEAEAKESEF